ncbi:MAG: zeta toxin family protein [Clostridia bacterium]|nr:zeta toxin family protein [Clostridia bacterium]
MFAADSGIYFTTYTFANGYNCTLDGTGDGSLKSMKKKIEEAQANGYSVEGVYVTCPTELAVERNAKRSKTDEYNRLVGEGAVRNIHAAVSKIFPEVAPLMDHVVLYDTNRKDSDGKPLKLAECRKGQKIQIVPGCEKYYQEFLDKGNE